MGGVYGGACRRTPCAERVVILPAVQSLRLLVRRGDSNGAGPAGWLRESGSRLPQSKASGGRDGREAERELSPTKVLFGGGE